MNPTPTIKDVLRSLNSCMLNKLSSKPIPSNTQAVAVISVTNLPTCRSLPFPLDIVAVLVVIAITPDHLKVLS